MIQENVTKLKGTGKDLPSAYSNGLKKKKNLKPSCKYLKLAHTGDKDHKVCSIKNKNKNRSYTRIRQYQISQ